MSGAGETIVAIVNTTMKPIAKEHGFRKKGLNFFRRRNQLVQVVNVQLSHGNSDITGGFFVNIGIAFDELHQLDNTPISEKLPEVYCHFRRRIHHFYPEAPDMWKISPDIDIAVLSQNLREAFTATVTELNGINSIPDMIIARSDWFRGSGYGLLARFHYVMGDLEAAMHYLELEAGYFVDRQGMSISKLIERYHFDKLKPR